MIAAQFDRIMAVLERIANPRPKLRLSEAERNWVRLKWGKIRTSQQAADKAGNEWNRINTEINTYLDEKGINDIVQRNKIKSQSIPLADALGTGKWHAAESQRHIDDLNLFLRMKELDLL